MAKHNCHAPDVCLGVCASNYNYVISHTQSVFSVADNFNNAYDVVADYAVKAAGKSAPDRFTGAVLHGLVETEVLRLAKQIVTQPEQQYVEVCKRGLAMWISPDEQKARLILSNLADNIIEFAEVQTKLKREDLTFFVEAPVVVLYGKNQECCPRYADIVVVKTTRPDKVLLVIDLFFTSIQRDIENVCAEKLRGLRYIKDTNVRAAFCTKHTKLAVLTWKRPNLVNMASIVTFNPAVVPKQSVLQSTDLAISPVPVQGQKQMPQKWSKSLHDKRKELIDTVRSKFQDKPCLVKITTPYLKFNSKWEKYPTLVAKYHNSKSTNLAIITPIRNHSNVQLSFVERFQHVEWVAESIEELEKDNPNAFLYPILVGTAAQKANVTQEKREDKLMLPEREEV